MRALFRGLMVLVSFLLFLALYGAATLAVIAAGPVWWGGMKPEDLPTLLPQGSGTPSPYAIAAGLGLVATLFIGMIAMLISERVHTVARFTGAVAKTAFWFALFLAGGLAFWLQGQPGAGVEKFLPAILLAAGLLAAAVVSGIVLGKPFLWWVSERPPQKRRPAAQAVIVEPLPPAPPPEALAPAPVEPAAPPVPETTSTPRPEG